MEEMKLPDIDSGKMAEEIIFDNSEIRTVRLYLRAYSEEDFHSREEGEWLTVLKGEVAIEVGNKTVSLSNGAKTFIPSGSPNRFISSSDPCLLLAVFHK